MIKDTNFLSHLAISFYFYFFLGKIQKDPYWNRKPILLEPILDIGQQKN